MRSGLTPCERFVPGQWAPKWIREAHRERYLWAGGLCENKDVLDVACGSGFGTVLLATMGARTAVGLDLDSNTLQLDPQAVSHPAASFEIGNVLDIPYPDATFDAVVSFETIEHVEDTDRYLSEVARVLRSEGLLLCSTPNRTVTNPGTAIGDKPYNPFHFFEFNAQEFREKIGSRFEVVEILGQAAWPQSYATALARTARLHRMLPVRLHQARKIAQSILSRDTFRPLPVPNRCEPETLVIRAILPRPTT